MSIELANERTDLPTDVERPDTGELVDLSNVDDVLRAIRDINDLYGKLRPCKAILCQAAEAMARKGMDGSSKTLHLEGSSIRAKVVLPSVSWDKGALKKLWTKYTALAETYLAIESVKVDAREVKKLANKYSNDELLMTFKDEIAAANRGEVGPARVIIGDDR